MGSAFSGHDQSRARPPQKVTRQIFGHAQACPTPWCHFSVETVTTLSAETQRREYPEFIIQLSPRRQGMKLKHALQIAGVAAPASRES